MQVALRAVSLQIKIDTFFAQLEARICKKVLKNVCKLTIVSLCLPNS